MRLLVVLALLAATGIAGYNSELLKASLLLAIDEILPHGNDGLSKAVDPDLYHAQMIGDIMQEATRLLVEHRGESVLKQFEGMDVLGVLLNLLPPKSPISSFFSESENLSDIERPVTCDNNTRYRSITGWCNHDETKSRGWGSAMGYMRRFMGEAKYDDGFNSIRRKAAKDGVLPSTRLISNKIFAEGEMPVFDAKYNHLLMQFGQWIAHDIVFTPRAVGKQGEILDCTSCESAEKNPNNCAPIKIPKGDPYFPSTTEDGKPFCTGVTRVPNGQQHLGAREQFSLNSHFIDLSQVYGSNERIAKQLRAMAGGEMDMFTEDWYSLPPKAFNVSNCKSENATPPYHCFFTGDARSNFHPGLVPMHTIYLKQHNNWAGQMQKLRPTWNDETIYQETRRLMIAMFQKHVYTEYLPKIIGSKKMNESGLNSEGRKPTYEPTVNPSVSVEFIAAAFRFGHSQARKDLPRVDNVNATVGSYVDLGHEYLYSDSLYDRDAPVDSMAQGMVNCPAKAAIGKFSFPIRNQLFENRGMKASGNDLPAINVMRGRELGVHPYNEVRAKIPGLAKVASFDELKGDMDPANVELLKEIYESVDDIDLYVGLLLEKPVDPDALLGPTATTIIADQFAALKKGDRYFYENEKMPGKLTVSEYEAINNYSLAQLICENVDGMEYVQKDIFQFQSPKVRCSEFASFPMVKILRPDELTRRI